MSNSAKGGEREITRGAQGTFRSPTAYLDRFATMRFIRTRLLGHDNPDTGQIYTLEDLARISKFPARDIRDALGLRDPNHPPLPQVTHGEVPGNEQAFFLGLAHGNYQIGYVDRGRTRFVVIGTRTKDEARKDLLRKTIGIWGEVNNRKEDVRIYVDSPMFDFMIEPIVSADFLRAKSRFAPFLRGMLAARLSDRQSRLSLRNADLLKEVQRRFPGYFGFSMGDFEIEEVHNGNGRETSKVPVICLSEPEKVLGALEEVDSVRTLSFFPSLPPFHRAG